MQVKSVAPAARRERMLSAGRHRRFAAAMTLVGSSFWLLATQAAAQGGSGQITIGGLGADGVIPFATLCNDKNGNLYSEGFGECDGFHEAGPNQIADSKPNGNIIASGTISAGTLRTDGSLVLVGGAPIVMTGGNITGVGTIAAAAGTFATLTTTGKATLDSLEVTNDAEVKGNLTVDGTTTLNGTLDMKGNDIRGVGTISASAVTASTGAFSDALTVHGSTFLGISGLPFVNTETGIGFDVGDKLTVKATSTFDAPVTVNAKLTANSLEVTADAEVKGNLEVGGNLDMTGGNVENVGTITAVTGNITTLNTTTIVNSSNTKTKTLTVDENAAVGGQLAVAGNAVLSGGAEISNHLAVAPSSTIDMGGNRVENVADPVALTDAANKGYVDAGLARAFRDIDRNTEGVALAMAMAGTPTLLPMENFALTANWGQFEGAHGLAAGFALRLDSNIQLNGGVAYGPNENTVGTRAGVRIGW